MWMCVYVCVAARNNCILFKLKYEEITLKSTENFSENKFQTSIKHVWSDSLFFVCRKWPQAYFSGFFVFCFGVFNNSLVDWLIIVHKMTSSSSNTYRKLFLVQTPILVEKKTNNNNNKKYDEIQLKIFIGFWFQQTIKNRQWNNSSHFISENFDGKLFSWIKNWIECFRSTAI